MPARGPVLLAANHRSYFDVAALALVAREVGRPVRFLGKKEIFDAPVVGQIARAIGARAIGTARTPAKIGRVRELGLGEGIVVPDGVFAQEVLARTSGRGVDVALELVGGACVAEDLACLADRGRIVVQVAAWTASMGVAGQVHRLDFPSPCREVGLHFLPHPRAMPRPGYK